jgi:hypothetical protein
MRGSLTIRIASSLALVSLLACGGETPREDAAADPAAEAGTDAGAAPAEAPAPAAPAVTPLAVEDIDRWEKGMAGELEAVKAAGEQLKSAKTGEDTLSAMMAVQEMNTIAAGATAAGVDQERYKLIRSDLSAAAGYLTPELGGIDTTMLSPEQRAELMQGNKAQLERLKETVPADVIEALRPRAAELRKKDLELVGARLQGVGAGR